MDRKIIPKEIVVGNDPVIRVKNGIGYLRNGDQVDINAKEKPFKDLLKL